MKKNYIEPTSLEIVFETDASVQTGSIKPTEIEPLYGDDDSEEWE